MALSVLNNIASLAAQNQLSITNSNLQKSLFQLSSGSRINSGADDAAGLAIADGLHANITALTQSARNANDGVGELQVADGSLAQVTTLLNRAVTLATESATGTVSDQQRVALNAEYTAIKAEIDRIGSKTNYNGAKVFSAASLDVFLSDAGATSNSTIGVSTGLLSSAGLGLGGTTFATATLVQGGSTPADAAQAVFTTTAPIVANDTVSVAGTTYTFVADVTAAPAANQVALGADQTAALANLALAVNGGGVAGVNYATGTVANAFATATSDATTATFTATTAGVWGNSLASTVTGTAGNTFAGAVFAGGADAIAGTGIAANGDTVTVGSTTYTFVTALNTTPTANEVLVGSTEELSLANLAAAVNGGAGAGTTYGSPTVANTDATAQATPTTVVFTALAGGTGGNALASTATGGGSDFATATFAGGAVGTPNDLSSIPDATAALATINTSIQTVAALRGTIGATVNRLQSAANVINNQVQNLTGAEDGVRAADIPSTVATLAKYSILEQTGISALAQANQQQQLVLKLLQ